MPDQDAVRHLTNCRCSQCRAAAMLEVTAKMEPAVLTGLDGQLNLPMLLKEDEAATLLRCSTRTLKRMRDAGTIKYIPGRPIRYRTYDILRMIEAMTSGRVEKIVTSAGQPPTVRMVPAPIERKGRGKYVVLTPEARGRMIAERYHASRKSRQSDPG